MATGSMRRDRQSEKFAAARAPANVLKEFESKSPEELLAARPAWDKNASANGKPSWNEMISARFGDGDKTTLLGKSSRRPVVT